MKKGLSLYEFHVFGWFPGLQNLKFTVELVWKSFSDKNNSLELPVFLLYSLPYDPEESRELWILISCGLGS